MSRWSDQFDHMRPFDSGDDFEAFLKNIPARRAVCLLADAEGRPVQLLCVANMRRSVERRLGSAEAGTGASRRVDYRALIRQLHWREVGSAFEGDIVYLELARELFPRTYRKLIAHWTAWYVHVDPEAAFPRYVKTTDPVAGSGLVFGPLENRNCASKLIELLEDAFDLCRYHNILTQAPNGLACAYKEMGKCPAPCDGSISMEQYRGMISRSAAFLSDPAPVIGEQKERMASAAGELRFELAGRIKTLVDQLSQIGKGSYQHVRRIDQDALLSLQRGRRPGTADLFLIAGGQVRQCACLTGLSNDFSSLPDHLGEELRAMREQPMDANGAERLGVVAHHLFAPRSKPWLFLPFAEVTGKSLTEALRQLHKKKNAEEEDDEDLGGELSVSETGNGGGDPATEAS